MINNYLINMSNGSQGFNLINNQLINISNGAQGFKLINSESNNPKIII